MKRSEINHFLDEGITFLKSRRYSLPPQAFWTLSEWNKNRDKATELAKRRIGWDLTDFGSGNYKRIGLLLYTLSNGIVGQNSEPVDQPFSNKLLIVGENQVTPLHHHRMKVEDIINLGGGNLLLKMFNVGESESIDKASPVKIFHNEIWEEHGAGTVMTLEPGERVRLDPCHYHEFCGQRGKGAVLLEEVASVNDDRIDNFFVEEASRFPEITDDQMPKYLLCTELPGTERFNELVRKYLKAG